MSGRDCCLFCGTDSNISTRMGNDKSRSLHVISILHKLLQIPIWECGKYLDFASTSSSPPPGTDWLILCTTCSSMIAQGHDLVQQLDRVQNQLGKIQTTLRNQIANPRKKAMTKTKAKIVDQLKRDISRRMGPDNISRRSSTKRSFSNSANFSPLEQQDSIDDMNLGILVEDIKIEDSDFNLDDDDLNVGPSGDEEGSNFFIESGDEEAEGTVEDDDCEITDVRELKKPKITGNTAPRRSKPAKKKKRALITLPRTESNCSSGSEIQDTTQIINKKGKDTKKPKQEEVTFQDTNYTVPAEYKEHFTYVCTVEGGDGLTRKDNGIRGSCTTCTTLCTIPVGSYYNWRRHLKMHGIEVKSVTKPSVYVKTAR